MKRTLIGIGAVMFVAVGTPLASDPATKFTPEQVIERSIAHHDPNGVWNTARLELSVHTLYSEAFAKKRGIPKTAELELLLSPAHEQFECVKTTGDDKVVYALSKGVARTTVNGSADVSDEDRERLRLAEPKLYRDYYEYLFGMPMKLRDPGARLDPRVKRVSFNGQTVLQMRVTYDPDVGSETWYFYFDEGTYALVGYRFYKDEAKNDGEYITFEGEIVDNASGLRLPKQRAWYYNDGSGHLATDDIVSIQTSAK